MEPDFHRAQLEATKLLLQQNINSLHIDVRNFNFDKKIIIDSVQNYAKTVKKDISSFTSSEFNGCSVIKIPEYDLNIILFDETEQNEERKHWGIAHEVGHIYLNHTRDGRIEEIEAHYFAAQIITPEIVLLYLAQANNGYLNSNDIYSYFNCSYLSASKRIKTLNSYRWSYNEYDKQLLLKFKPIVNNMFRTKRDFYEHKVYPKFEY